MSNFTTRIELHGATVAEYEKLHSAMQKAGFSRTILSNKGQTHILPTAEYICSGQSLDQVLSTAGKVASTTDKTYSILVSETTNWGFVGLAQK